ncbi:MAG: hypothetical protein R6W70_00195 [bacterium]
MDGLSILTIISLIFYFIGWLMLVIAAFREAAVWGLLCLFFPVIFLLFIAVHWQVSVKPLLFVLVGVGFHVLHFLTL